VQEKFGGSEPFVVPAKAKNQRGGLEYLRVMLSKEGATDFTRRVSSLTVVAGLYLCQRQLLYHPDRARPVLGTLARLGVREVAIPTADGLPLLAWCLPKQ